ncbi:MAG: PAS domain S-box protein, partial [Thermodesulfobacteriota bacterium]
RLRQETSHKSYYSQLSQQLEKLRQREEDLSLTLNSIGEGVIVTDRQGRITRMNPMAESLTGWALAEVRGAHLGQVFRIVNGHTREACQDPVQKVLESGRIQGLANNTLLLARDGREYQIADSAAPIQDRAEREIRGVVLVFRVVSQEDAMHKRLQESEAAYRSLFQNSPVGIFRSTSRGELLQANPAMARMMGFTSPEQAVEYYQDLGKQLYPEPRIRENFIWALREQGQVQGFEYQALCYDGQMRWLSITARVSEYVTDEDFVLDGFVWDVSPRKEQEAHLEQARRLLDEIIEFLPDAILVIDTQGKVIAWNRAIEELTGAAKEDMLGKGDYEYGRLLYGKRCPILVDIVLTDSQDRPSLEEDYQYISWKEEIIYGEAYASVVNNGKGAHLWGAAGKLRDAAGNLIGAIESIRDVSERKNLELQLQQARKMEAVGTLAGGIAHDFNNILQIINGYTNLMLEERNSNDPEWERLLQIQRSGRHGSELVKKLLTFSRKVEGEKQILDLNQEVKESAEILRSSLPRMIDIRLDLDQELWPVDADAVQLEQILFNLGSNAGYAMPDGGVLEIETKNVVLDADFARLHPGLEPGEYVLLSVSDTGCGMDEETREKVFEPFFTTKEMGRGTGLGLASVYGIIKAHQGHVLCYSKPGQGTTFQIYLPARPETEQEEKKALQKQENKSGIGTILVVDDEPAIQELTQEMLQAIGCNAICAASGEEALQSYQKNQDEIDLVLLDLGMPGMGGYNCLLELLRKYPGVKVLVASGYAANVNAEQVLQAGAAGFLSKPFQMQDLEAKLREVLDKQT